jgi:predicted nucleic acid binding AN1-type Zn finger protein
MDRCCTPGCKKKINILAFTCKFCEHKYCVSHQLPESHACDIKRSKEYEGYVKKNSAEWVAATDKDAIKDFNQKLHRHYAI